MSVKYVYVPASPWEPLIRILVGLLLAALVVGGIAGGVYYFWPEAAAEGEAPTTSETTAQELGGEEGPSFATHLGEDEATVYVVDNSGSIMDYVDILQEQIRNVGAAAPEGSQAALIFFGVTSTLALPLGPIETEHWENASAGMLGNENGTYMFDAALEALALLQGIEEQIAKTIVILTDGTTQDEELKEDFIKRAIAEDVKVNTIAFGGLANNRSRKLLQEISNRTGGEFEGWQAVSQ